MFPLNHFLRLRGLSLVIAISIACLSGCKDNPGKWAPDKVTTKVAESLEVTDLTLNSTANGLEGTGKRSDGETITVVVKQDSAGGTIAWDAKGDRGFVETGSYSLAQ
jgi:hypothetical protein